jgi:hypothetical protein
MRRTSSSDIPDYCQRLAFECFVPSYTRTFTPTERAARFHSSRSSFAIQRRSRFRLVGFGKSAGESAHTAARVRARQELLIYS